MKILIWDITAELVSAITLCIILGYARKGNLLPTVKNKVFQYCLFITFLSVSSNIISTTLLQYYKQVPLFFNSFFLLIYYLSTPLMGAIYFIYALANIYDEKEVKKYAALCSLPSILYVLLVFSNFYTSLLFSFDQVSGYQQGPWIFITYLVFYIYVFFSLILVIHKRKSLERNVSYILGVFPFISAFVILFQYIHPEYILTGTAATSALLIIYLYLQNKQMFTDTLTNLLNRQEFNKMIDILIDNNKPFIAVVISLKNFKFINDKFGQEIGDQILLEVCHYLRYLLPKQAMYRYGGDEFALIFYDKKNVINALEKIEKRMKNPWQISNIDFIISYVAGGIAYPKVAHSKEEIINGLEYAVSLGKKDNAHNINFCVTAMIKQIRRKYQILDLLRICLENNSFEVYFQPIYDLKTHSYCKAEALLRLPDNPLGFISPEEFIPIAEENGLIAPITYQVLDKTCLFIKKVIAEKKDFTGVSINFSVLQFMQDDLENKVLKVIEKHQLPYELIKIEITESMLVTNFDVITNFMTNMINRGIQFLLDDFGTGYSNITYVLTIPFQVVKVDKSLIWQAMKDEKAAILIKKMIEAFNQIGLHILAEGIETKEQMEFMKKCGCDLFQGYYFSRPVPFDESLNVIKTTKITEKE